MSGLPTTTDTFYHGKVIVKQLKKGYRFAVDSPILAAFLPRSTRPALEVGCGVGRRLPAGPAAEKIPGRHRHRDPGSAVSPGRGQRRGQRLAGALPGHPRRFQPHPSPASPTCRPSSATRPFSRPDSGHVSPEPTIRLARFEVALTLAGLLRGCAAALAPRGKVFLIFPFARQEELLATSMAHGLHAARLRPVRPFADSPPDRFLVQLQKTKAKCRHEEPLVFFRDKGIYTPEMAALLAGN